MAIEKIPEIGKQPSLTGTELQMFISDERGFIEREQRRLKAERDEERQTMAKEREYLLT